MIRSFGVVALSSISLETVITSSIPTDDLFTSNASLLTFLEGVSSSSRTSRPFPLWFETGRGDLLSESDMSSFSSRIGL